jgi:hypothetical protein
MNRNRIASALMLLGVLVGCDSNPTGPGVAPAAAGENEPGPGATPAKKAAKPAQEISTKQVE